jgi:hypothetical protein
MFWGFLITAVCVGVPVGGGLALAAWKAFLKSRPPELDPMRILAARFASGEIGEDEYAHRLRVLLDGPADTQLDRSAPSELPSTTA